MKRFELSTLSLARRCSTTELHPQLRQRDVSLTTSIVCNTEGPLVNPNRLAQEKCHMRQERLGEQPQGCDKCLDGSMPVPVSLLSRVHEIKQLRCFDPGRWNGRAIDRPSAS